MNTILDYKTPTPRNRHLSFRTAAIAGGIAGAATLGSMYVVGPLLGAVVGLMAGIVLSAIAARASNGFEFRAGFLASAFAAVSAFATSIVFSFWFGRGSSGPDLAWSGLVLIFWWPLFALPGMLGSLWVWEGRRPRPWDEAPRPEIDGHAESRGEKRH